MATLFEASVGERRWPLRPSIVIPDGPSLTYTEMRRQIREVGDFLQKEGVQKEHRVSLALGNSLEYVVAFFAITSLGAVAAPLIPEHSFEECLFYLTDGGIKGLVVGKNQSENARKAARRLHVPVWEFSVVRGKVNCESIPHFYSPEEKGDGPGPYGSESVPNDPSIIHWTGDPPKPSNPALLLYTSGTTSKPKGVLLTHGNLVASLRNIQQTYHLTENDTSFIVMPLFHVHGLIGALLSTLTSGGTAVIPPKFSAHSFWRQFDKYKCTWYSAVPTIHQILLLSKSTYFGSPSLRFIRSCSAPLAPATLKELENTFSAPVIEAYAMTEASHQMCSNPLPPEIHKAGSVGKGTGVEIRLLDSTGVEVKRGELGEVCLKGPSVMVQGYLHRPEATIQAFTRDGYFRTGDQGFLDEDGYIFLTGRLKELINRGGEKISPPEVDSVLLKHPSVAEAICFGVPHKIYGEEIEAAIVLKEPERDEKKLQTIRKAVTDFCKDLLAPFKCPKVIWITTELPKTASGKIQRRNVSEHFVKVAAETVRTSEFEKVQIPTRAILSKL